MWLNIPDEDFGLVVGSVEQLRAMAVLMDAHDELREGLDRLVSTLNNPRSGGVVKKYRALHDGLSDMVEGERVIKSDIPDDYEWLVRLLEELAGLDPDAEAPHAP